MPLYSAFPSNAAYYCKSHTCLAVWHLHHLLRYCSPASRLSEKLLSGLLKISCLESRVLFRPCEISDGVAVDRRHIHIDPQGSQYHAFKKCNPVFLQSRYLRCCGNFVRHRGREGSSEDESSWLSDARVSQTQGKRWDSVKRQVGFS